MSEDKRAPAAAYVSWSTFKNSIDQFADGVLPNRIDRSLFPTQSGAVQYQLIAALKFLGLVDDNDEPSATLKELASADEERRKAILKDVVQKSYADLFSLDLMKATPAQLSEQMSQSYGVGGSTRTKAVRFFVSAVKFVEIPIAPLLDKTAKSGTSSGNGQRKRRRKKKEVDSPPSVPPTPAAGPEKTISLVSGGSVSLTVNFDPFSVSDQDREFVFGLISSLRDYESKCEAPEGGRDEEV